MISVIIPVYNVEKYLPACIESVLCQTYKDLDIILVDDGSKDSGGRICDEYAEKDPRIRVIHTENKGLSAARNVALDHILPESEWISFVDSDDYIDCDMFENLLKEGSDSDIIECGLIKEYKTKQKVELLKKGKYGTKDAFKMLLSGKIRNYAWDKLYRKELFREIRFPVGRNYEDIAVQYQLICASDYVTIIDGAYYHYVCRVESITSRYKIKDLVDRWLSYYERYEFSKEIPYVSQDEELYRILLSSLRGCAEMIWEWFYHNPKAEREKALPMVHSISRFYRENIPFWGFPDMSFGQKMIGIMVRSSSKISLAMTYCIFQSYMKLFHKFDTEQLVT